MNRNMRVAVCSRSFSKNKILRSELLKKYKHVTFNDKGVKLEEGILIKFLSGHGKAIVALERLDDFVLSQLPDLKVVGKYGVGLDMIDMDAMKRYGKQLGWIGGVNRRSVSELVISFAISLLRHVPAAHCEVLSGTWRQHVGSSLSGKTVGIIGCGFIGKDLVKMLKPFGCTILANDIIDQTDFYKKHQVLGVTLEEILMKSDVLTLHLPLDNSTRNLLTAERMSLMKHNAILINTARGGLVDERALKEMLKNGKIAAAAFDVFEIEPPEDFELIKLDNFLVTPHIGGSSKEAILAMGMAAIESLDGNYIVNKIQ